MTVNAQKHIDILGARVKDQVTGFEGVVSTVSFDLYGCIQCVVTPPLDKDGNMREGRWFDIGRLKVLDATPVMERPDYSFTKEAVSKGKKGPAEKPAW